MKRLARELLVLAVLVALLATDVHSETLPPYPEIGASVFTMDGYSLFTEPEELEPFCHNGRAYLGSSAEFGRVRVHLDFEDFGNTGRWTWAISGGSVELDGKVLLRADATLEECKALLGEPISSSTPDVWYGTSWYVQDNTYIQYSAKWGGLVLTRFPLQPIEPEATVWEFL